MIARHAILGAIIAGGQAARMGGLNKPLQLLAGKPLIRHVYDRLEPQVSALMANANRDLDLIAQSLPASIAICPDKNAFQGAGPLAGLHAALSHANANDLGFVATVAADTPFFPANLVEKLSHDPDPSAIRIARQDGYNHPLFGLWPTAILPDLENFLRSGETYKVMAFAKRHPVIHVDIEDADDPFFNINTADDLAVAEQMIAGALP
ncbi:MAG: molybdenum cofactor guanylyltransferase MobA [Pseudomonadota bacterium]